ncbi:MAG: phenylalanine--tRNA ligase subunit alpha [bacterium]|nr:phenylalanine--tRNA ligase subunit alpha [bacterium]
MTNEKGQSNGHMHPISRAIFDIWAIFRDLGFDIAVGPEIETEWYNFDAVNMPPDHPARDMQDTLWLKQPEVKSEKLKVKSQRPLLRTHVSGIQVRHMEAHKPPIRIMYPGKVFRNEATDATHEAAFHQIEWLLVDKAVSVANLKGVIEHFLRAYFEKDMPIRFRPSYFPFTEPSLEVDMQWKGKWLEIIGAGLVHPNVFKAAKIDPNEWQGLAFAAGLDRLIMLKYGIPDVRMFYNGDLRLVNQF